MNNSNSPKDEKKDVKQDWKKYELLVFDLDNTLTPSKEPADKEMANLLTQLLDTSRIAVVSGGNFKEFETDLLGPLPKTSNFSHLSIFPTDGTSYFKYSDKWNLVYMEKLSTSEKNKIKKAFEETLQEISFTSEHHHGKIIEDRESSITFSALGQKAPLDEKQNWDPERKKRVEIKNLLDIKIPEFEVNIAGTTSIDITAKGLDKAYAIKKMVEYLKVPIDKMIFIGDALFEGGNDYDVLKTGIETIKVDGPEDTKKIIREIILQK